jgi:acyl carrier protein
MNDIKGRIAHCFSNVFPNIRPEEIPRASTASLAAWDSVAQVTLLSSVAEEFGLNLQVQDFEELVSYALILDYVESKSVDG